ncbi:MAG: CGGC domain-containing protein [Desulfovibrionales bacterium]
MPQEKILIIGCKNAMDDICIGCSRCLVSFNRREGMFERYQGNGNAEILGLLSCGGCPGPAIVTRLAQVKLWNAPLNEKPTKIHIAPCIGDHCPYADDIITKIKVKSHIEVIEGTHPYAPSDIFA